MANWQYRINFTDSREAYDKDGDLQKMALAHVIKIKELIESVKKDLRRTIREMAKELENEILPMFEEVAENEDMDVDDYDNALECLYDWADTPLDRQWAGKKMCWVETMLKEKIEVTPTAQVE